jgi:glycosyltransferase involved in cell wall biosynthesis
MKLTIAFITLNEEKNLPGAFNNIKEIADQIVVVDSFSTDNTIQICRDFNVDILQNKFEGFGAQWNYVLNSGVCKNDLVMKMDPDERIDDELKKEILTLKEKKSIQFSGFFIKRRLLFNQLLTPVSDKILRIWKNGSCKFSDVIVNEHPIVKGKLSVLNGELLHLDSYSLSAWVNKQNNYSQMEAKMLSLNHELSYKPNLLGNSNERRMFLKKYFDKIPLSIPLFALFLYVQNFSFKYHKGLVEWIVGRIFVQLLIRGKKNEYRRKKIEI